jgi:hypothetical protein
MANTIRIKRTTSSNRPASLANAELAFIEGSQILVYGTGTGGASGSATSIIDVGGTGAFLGLSNSLTQTAAGTYTFSGTVTFSGTTSLGSATATTQSSSDNSTKVATTAFVKSQGYLTAETYTGTVTSVALSLPSIFTVSGSPVSSSGTLSASLATQAANKILAGPNTGADASPTFRALVAADIPTLTASKISDFTSSVTAVRLDQHAAPTADVSFNSYKLTNLATPTSDSDAATKAYVDAARSGLDVKNSVRVATTANITLSGTQTIDGVALSAGDRVLVKNQTAGAQNGIYVVAAGSWVRSTDADSDAEVTPGMFTFIEEGTANADSGWVLSTNSTITLGTTSLAFAQFSGAGTISVDATLSKSGSTIGLASGVATAGTYKSVTVDTYGRITAGTNPTTLSGYGITDAQSQISATGLLKGAGAGSVSAATAGTDYLSPSSDIDGGSYP